MCFNTCVVKTLVIAFVEVLLPVEGCAPGLLDWNFEPQIRRMTKKRKISAATAVAMALPSCKSLTTSPHFMQQPTARTLSFGAIWAGNFPSLVDQQIKVHTLILGTHPSIRSLKEEQYFGHPMK